LTGKQCSYNFSLVDIAGAKKLESGAWLIREKEQGATCKVEPFNVIRHSVNTTKTPL
jgi:hypothetical protein